MESVPIVGPGPAIADPSQFTASAERAGELIIYRPRVRSGGAARAFKVHLDGRHVATLSEGNTVRLPATEGQHEIAVRCWPHARVRLSVDLAPYQSIRVQTHLSPLRELEMCLDDLRDRVPSP